MIPQRTDSSLELRVERLEIICEHIGEAVISASETVEHLSSKINALVEQMEQEQEKTSQQGYQILALSESLQTLVEINTESTIRVQKLTSAIENLLTMST
ncbi:conserved hypothetical protein [Hyella patelloides LEGE 07179]|uniref:Uncharacterized protein n=1 Tax=Hyella patelloides LEGE 07179 TaxID=945734 RepID=A0A563VUQ1_9CYAN|nr:hypothetical protein [Hyella patelloides]VEP15114.1 conserved hypothetical protein [Hyella patelloides LEGE 07179]